MTSRKFKTTFLGLSVLASLGLSACFTAPYVEQEAAKRIAAPAWMINRKIEANGHALTVYERMHERYADANLYIEGDGITWVSGSRSSLNPTPVNPVALHMAAHDRAKNVAYLARPCQYSNMGEYHSMNAPDEKCNPVTWTDGRFSREVLDTMNVAIDEIKKRYDIKNFNLIGYDGGGAIAALLAAERNDVISLRTVAANLDHEAYTQIHGIKPLSKSLNAKDVAPKLTRMPQQHFIGGQDKIVPPTILHGYLQALGNTNCADYTFIQEAEHEAGWVEKWPEFLAKPASCQGPLHNFANEQFEPFEPVYMPRPALEKP